MISALLLASVAAMPAMAQDHHHGDGQDNSSHQENGGRHDDGGNGGRHNDGNGPRPAGPAQAQVRPQPQAQAAPLARGQLPANSPWRSGGQFDRPAGQPRGDQARFQGDQGRFQNDRSQGWQGRGDGDGGRHVEGRADNGVQVWRDDRGGNDRARPGGWSNDRGRVNGWTGDRGRPGGWNNGWRNDHRYDWQGWRNTHRDQFHVGRYRPPYGTRWGYRRWGIGVRIDPIFFAQDYWITDPWYYRLPPADGPYRWVRYYNDALLIDTYSGTVVDEIPDFFW